MQTNAVGQVVLKLKTRWPDGTTHLVMSPLECMQRLALVPRLRLHMIRFHGVLARSLTTSAKLRALVVPQEPEPAAQAAQPAQCEANCAHHRPVRLSWAKLLKRVFEIDLKHCPNCGGELQDHCCHPGATGDREDPRAPGAAADCGRRSACARSCASGGACACRRMRGLQSAACKAGHRLAQPPAVNRCKRLDDCHP